MKLRVGELYAQCPYCGNTDFLPHDADGREVVCAACEGHASRLVLLERLGDSAAELARISLSRLAEERRRKRKKRS
jgi:hypothetical protein